MKRARILGALGVLALFGCKTVRVYPLSGPFGDPAALFEPLLACAAAEQLEHRRRPDAVDVQVKPGVWAQFTPRGEGYTLVVVVDDGTMGGDREGHADYAKRKGEALFACAMKTPLAGSTATEAPTETPAASPEVAEPPASDPASSASPK